MPFHNLSTGGAKSSVVLLMEDMDSAGRRCCLVALTVSLSIHFGFLSLTIIGCLWQKLSIWKVLQQQRKVSQFCVDSNCVDFHFHILVIFSQQTFTSSSDFQFFSLWFHSPSLMDLFVIFFINAFIFQTSYHGCTSARSHIIINVSVSLKAPWRSASSATIRRNQLNVSQGKPEHKAAAPPPPPSPLYKWRLQTCGVLILHWADGDVDQSGDEEGQLSLRLLRMKRRSVQLGDITSKSFLPARIWAPFKNRQLLRRPGLARLGPAPQWPLRLCIGHFKTNKNLNRLNEEV